MCSYLVPQVVSWHDLLRIRYEISQLKRGDTSQSPQTPNKQINKTQRNQINNKNNGYGNVVSARPPVRPSGRSRGRQPPRKTDQQQGILYIGRRSGSFQLACLQIPSYTSIYFHIFPNISIYAHILHILQNIQYYENEERHETQKWSWLGPQGVSKSEKLTQSFLPCLQRLWHTQRDPTIPKTSFKEFWGGHKSA